MTDHMELANHLDTKRRLVCGYPKTGRTWLRFMLANALSNEHDLSLDLNLNNVYSVVPNEERGTITGQPPFRYKGSVPRIEMSHRQYQPEFSEAQLVFMARDPRDVMVSHWLHDTLQVKIFEGSLSEFVRSPTQGIEAFVSHLETWSPNISTDQVVTYEGMRSAPQATISHILNQLDVSVSESSLEYAVTQGDISRMRTIEVESGIAGHDYDRSNPEARRVRAGEVGGFLKYLSESDLLYIENTVKDSSASAQRIIEATPYPINQE